MSKDPSIVDAEIVEDSPSADSEKANPEKETAVKNSAVEKNELSARLLSAEHWLRFVFMVLFALIACAASYVVVILIVIQFLFALITGNGEKRLTMFGGSLSTYLFQILQYLTYNSDEKPFPFKDWPEAEDIDSDRDQV